jgi:hypothetical protein
VPYLLIMRRFNNCLLQFNLQKRHLNTGFCHTAHSPCNQEILLAVLTRNYSSSTMQVYPDPKSTPLALLLNARFILFYIILFLLFSQLHEMSHILTGRFICGCFGEQLDFNIWSLCGNCFEENAYGIIPSLAGPAFSFICIWFGVYLLMQKRKDLLMIGFLLVLINKPFARLFTVAMRGGDELTAARKLFTPQVAPDHIWLITLGIVSLLTIPPLWICCKKLQNRGRVWIILLLCLLPMIFQYIYQFKFLNGLLKKGIGSDHPFMGIANLIHLHTIFLLLAALFLGRSWMRTNKKDI